MSIAIKNLILIAHPFQLWVYLTSSSLVMEYSSASQRLNTIKTYIACRVASSKPYQSANEMLLHAQKLKGFFVEDGILIDADKHTHSGPELLTYFRAVQPEPTEISEPMLQEDGRFLLQFNVYKMWMTWPIKAYFEFSGHSNLISKLEIHR